MPPCFDRVANSLKRSHGFTLVELLIVLLILLILAAIAIPNLQRAKERALMSANASNLRTIAVALQAYYVDYGDLPPADREAGPFSSHTREFRSPGNGPAAGGSWDAVPWLLFEEDYISNWETLFNAKYLQRFAGGKTIRGDWPRYHNFRYAYNSSAMSSGGHWGGDGFILNGDVWMARDLWLGPRKGFYAEFYPNEPADFEYPWGEGDYAGMLEHVLYSSGVKLVIGGTNREPEF